MSCKAVETTHNISKQTYNAVVAQEVFKEYESLEDEECSAQPLEADNNWEPSSKLILLQLLEKLLKNSTLDHSMVIGIGNKLERWKISISGCLMNWPKIKRSGHSEVSSFLILCSNNELFLVWLWHVMKSGFCMTTSNDQLSGWTKKSFKSSQSQICTRKRSWSLFGGLLPSWSITVFWILVKPLHLRSMLVKLMGCTENCNAWHWSTEMAQFSTMPNHMWHNQRFRSWMNWPKKFYLPCSSDLSSTDNHFFKHLHNILQGKCFHN